MIAFLFPFRMVPPDGQSGLSANLPSTLFWTFPSCLLSSFSCRVMARFFFSQLYLPRPKAAPEAPRMRTGDRLDANGNVQQKESQLGRLCGSVDSNWTGISLRSSPVLGCLFRCFPRFFFLLLLWRHTDSPDGSSLIIRSWKSKEWVKEQTDTGLIAYLSEAWWGGCTTVIGRKFNFARTITI